MSLYILKMPGHRRAHRLGLRPVRLGAGAGTVAGPPYRARVLAIGVDGEIAVLAGDRAGRDADGERRRDF